LPSCGCPLSNRSGPRWLPSRKEGWPAARFLAALAEHDCITFAALGGSDEWRFRNGESVRVHSRLVVNTAEAAVDGALCGVGLARVLEYQIAAAAKARKLAIVLGKFESAPLPVSLLYVRERRLTGKLRAFLDFIAPRLRARLE